MGRPGGLGVGGYVRLTGSRGSSSPAGSREYNVCYAGEGREERWLEASGHIARPATNGGGRKRKRLESGQSHYSCRGTIASGSPLITDRPLLLPPRVKTQMACFGWCKALVSYSLGSAQPRRGSRAAPWVDGYVGGVERAGLAGAVGFQRGGEGRVSESGSRAGILLPSPSFCGVGLPAA